MLAALSDPERHFANIVLLFFGRFRKRSVGNGGHPSSFDSLTVDVQGSDPATDRDGQSMPETIGQSQFEDLHPGHAQVSVV